MTRKFTVLLAASAFLLWTPSTKAADWPAFDLATVHALAPAQGIALSPAEVWPHVGHEPAITRVFSANPVYQAPQAPAPAYNYDWQQQPSPPAPVLAPPKFSHPQQGYFPREQLTPQIVPGYEYDFGGAGTYPPLYPIEGANWKAPRTYNRATSYSAVETHAPETEYAHCPY